MRVIFCAVAIWLVTPVHAAPAVCGDRAKLIEGLERRYKETPVALGISQKSTEVLEIFASEAGTWTAIMTMSSGVSCIMAAGHSWGMSPDATGQGDDQT